MELALAAQLQTNGNAPKANAFKAIARLLIFGVPAYPAAPVPVVQPIDDFEPHDRDDLPIRSVGPIDYFGQFSTAVYSQKALKPKVCQGTPKRSHSDRLPQGVGRMPPYRRHVTGITKHPMPVKQKE